MKMPLDMESAAWKQLSEDDRYVLIEPICEGFICEFGNLPKINHIGHTPYCIYVSTALPEGTLMDGIPNRYEGVPVQQDAVREAMNRFLATWTMILYRIGGWSPDRIADFANDRHIAFRSAFFLHYSPIDYVAGWLLSEKLLDVRGMDISNRICTAIESGISPDADPWHPDLDPNYNWLEARDRVNAEIRALEHEYVDGPG